MSRLWAAEVLCVLAVGCGGGAPDPASNPVAAAIEATETPLACTSYFQPGVNPENLPLVSVTLLNESGAAYDDDVALEVGYINDQLENPHTAANGTIVPSINAQWGINARASLQVGGSPNPNDLTVVLHPTTVMNGASFTDGSVWGVVQLDSHSAQDWPTRMDHILLNLLDQHRLIAEPYEAHGYNPIDYTETPFNGLYRLDDFVLAPGGLNYKGDHTQDFLGVAP